MRVIIVGDKTTIPKKCTKCGETKPLDEFYNDKSKRGGKGTQCKGCIKKISAKHYQEHFEEIKKRSAKHYQEHIDEIKEKCAKYYQEHSDKIKENVKKYRKEHSEETKEMFKKYRKEHSEELKKYGRKYYEEVGREKRGQQSMYINKSCSSYLGIVIGERLCRHLFKDVKVMPHGNPGFDIICNKGKMIDVKTSATLLDRGNPRWKFHIENNKIADFFICVAFDNRTDLNPLYMWMIPGSEINHLSAASIHLSTIHKWDKWKIDINDAKLCCNELKGSSKID